MHLGTLILTTILIAGLALLAVVATRTTLGPINLRDTDTGWEKYWSGFGIVVTMVGGAMAVIATLALLIGVPPHNACYKSAADYNVTVDYSWLNGCRTEAVLDGVTVLIPFDEFRFVDDLDLNREDT